MGSLFDVGSGGTPSRRKPEYWKGNIPWVSSGEVAFCEIKNTKECITKEGLENSSAKYLSHRNCSTGIIGEGKTRGQAAIFAINSNDQSSRCLYLFVPNPPIPSEYVYWWFCSTDIMKQDAIRDGSNQPNMYLHHVRNMAIPIAPILEQKEIVPNGLKSLLSVNDEIAKQC